MIKDIGDRYTPQMTAKAVQPPPESVVTLAFEVADSSVPVRAAAEMTDCRFRLEEMVPRDDGRYAVYYSVDGGNPDRILDLAAEHDDACRARFLTHSDSEALLELTGAGDRPLMVLAAHGAIPRHLVVEGGKKALTAEVLPEHDVNGVIAGFGEAYPDAELTARQQQPYAAPVFGNRGFERALKERLTERQREVLRAAHEEGFYEWPRAITGEQLSEDLGITPPTLHQHLRAAEQKLVRLAFDRSDI